MSYQNKMNSLLSRIYIYIYIGSWIILSYVVPVQTHIYSVCHRAEMHLMPIPPARDAASAIRKVVL